MKTVLIIEDIEDNLVLITRVMEKSGYQVLKAMTGREGLEMANKKRPDFIILDIQLPDMDGIEVLQLLRSEDETKEIPVIAMTSFAMAGDRERFLAAGCSGYIEKPIDPALVVKQIEKIIG